MKYSGIFLKDNSLWYYLTPKSWDREERAQTYLVSYDFIEEKPLHRFWSNLRDIITDTGGERIQYSVYYGERKGAKAIRELAMIYDADVRWFVAIELR